MNRQEVFNTAYTHARTMTEPAMQDGSCAYRSDKGPCLIGLLIKDEFYSNDIENVDAENHRVLSILQKSGLDSELTDTPEGGTFLVDLQQCHDDIGIGADFNLELMGNLKNFAAIYNLDIPNA